MNLDEIRRSLIKEGGSALSTQKQNNLEKQQMQDGGFTAYDLSTEDFQQDCDEVIRDNIVENRTTLNPASTTRMTARTFEKSSTA